MPTAAARAQQWVFAKLAAPPRRADGKPICRAGLTTSLVVERDNQEGLRRLEESSQSAVALVGGAATSAFDAAALSAASAGAWIALLPPPGAAPSLAPGDAYPESRT